MVGGLPSLDTLKQNTGLHETGDSVDPWRQMLLWPTPAMGSGIRLSRRSNRAWCKRAADWMIGGPPSCPQAPAIPDVGAWANVLAGAFFDGDSAQRSGTRLVLKAPGPATTQAVPERTC